jgi:transcriptional regulator with XRE-family HTH domain
MGPRLAAMILRELLAEYGMTTLTAFAQRAQLSISHAWNLWHGRATLGLNLAKRIAQQTGIPLARLIEVEPTPPTPYRGKGGPRRPPVHARTRKAPQGRPSTPPPEDV